MAGVAGTLEAMANEETIAVAIAVSFVLSTPAAFCLTTWIVPSELKISSL